MVKKFIEYDYCKVRDAIEVRRCYKCLGFNHMTDKCSAKSPVCPKCAGPHQLKECESDFLKCTHCNSLKGKNPDHCDNRASYDINKSPVFQNQLTKLRSIILGTK